MLAYLLWHRPADGVDRAEYERAATAFHHSLAHNPPAGFRGSVVYHAQTEPGSAQGGSDGVRSGYEDWYLVEDFAALGVLNEAAVGRGHRTPHDGVARRLGAAAGGLYGVLEGNITLASERVAVWVDRPRGAKAPTFAGLLGDGMDPQQSGLLRRALVLGPAPEYCVLGDEAPAGVGSARLPEGWSATVTRRVAVGESTSDHA